MMRGWLRTCALAALLAANAALAHKPSDSYLALAVDGATISGQWDIALRDLDDVLGLDRDQDGAITWGELKARHPDIAAYALSRLTLGPPAAPCVLRPVEHLVDAHSDGAYAVLRFDATCTAAPAALTVDYRLFFDVDAQHRGLVRLSTPQGTRSAILAVETPTQSFALDGAGHWRTVVDYTTEGVVHIWRGLDHVLFLLSLLLPAVLVRAPPGEGTWRGASGLRPAFRDVVRVVTAFTAAHSVTLSLAALGVIGLPARPVESLIAASVVLAALNNVRPVVDGGRWIVAFAFGLIHGFGFASVLADLGLPQDALALALVAFNVGVELGQLAIVAAFLPLAFLVRETTFYRRTVVVGGSVGVAALAAVWLVERAFDVVLLPGAGLGG
ncbi:MAG TPA: HupE/UreJ family protein [Casimicrobiaceae bacterium]|nr:HupE/UreJ family protein [Casimicrobiaceae bacterium]